MVIQWTKDLENDWRSLCNLWKQSDYVLQAAVGLDYEMPPQHKACIQFSERYSESKQFLIEQLKDRDPRIAAYAFKCLIRIADIQKDEIPNDVLSRRDKIVTLMRSVRKEKTIGEFINQYFENYYSQEVLLEEQEILISWHENILTKDKKQIEPDPDRDAC